MADLAFRKISRDTLTDQVIQEIRRMILAGRLQPGEMLPTQVELAAQLGVGVATVRRAVAALSAVGLLDSQPGRGTTVNPDGLAALQASALLAGPLDSSQTSMVYEARMIIEVPLTRLAAQRAKAEDLEIIRRALEDMEAVWEDDAAFTAADLRFHSAVAKASRNELLAQFYHVSHRLLSDVVEKVVGVQGIKERAVRLQWAVYEGIAAHDAERAASATAAQLNYVLNLLKRAGYIDTSIGGGERVER